MESRTDKIMEAIDKIPDNKTKAEIIIMFITELGGNIQNLKTIGLTFGADGYETRVGKAFLETNNLIENLNKKLIYLIK